MRLAFLTILLFFFFYTNAQIYDLEMLSITKPFSTCGLSSTDSIEIEFRNVGSDSISNIRVVVEIDGGNQIVSDSILTYVQPNAIIRHTFSATANFSLSKLYNCKAYLSSNEDLIKINDTIATVITNDTNLNGLYFQDFELLSNGWTISGVNSSLQWAFPYTNYIRNAFSGFFTYISNVNGDYNNNELSFLSSPCFDFTNFINDPMVSFALKHDIESTYDSLWIEYSLDNGVNWIKILQDSSKMTDNWYNNKTTNVWDGNSNNRWYIADNFLKGFAGQPRVKFRFVFKSDATVVKDGFAIDDFRLIESPQNDVSLRNIYNDDIKDSSSCRLANSPIFFQLSNRGVNPIDTIFTNFQINNGLIIRDTLIQTILGESTVDLQTPSFYDFSQNNFNIIKLWVDIRGYTIHYNDTLVSDTIIGSNTITSKAPYYEDFDYDFIHFGSGAYSGGWNSFFWKTSKQTSNSMVNSITDPTGDAFFYINFVNSELTSPCISIDSSTHDPQLSFLYYFFNNGNSEKILVDILSFGNWINLDTIHSNTTAATNLTFRKHNLDLNNFKNQIIKIRFRNLGSNYKAIDAFAISDGVSNGIINMRPAVLINVPCNTNRQYPIKARIANYSDSIFLPNTISINYKIANYISPLELIPDTIFPDQYYFYTLQNLGDFSEGNIIGFQTVATSNIRQTSLLDSSYSSIKTFPARLPIHEGFEVLDSTELLSWTTSNCDPILNPQNIGFEWGTNSDWQISDSTICISRRASNGSRYITADPRSYGTKTLELPCLDLSNYNKVDFSFDYAKFRFSVASSNIPLYIEVNSNNNWITVDSIINTPLYTPQFSYLSDTVSLDRFIGDTIIIRLRSVFIDGFPLLYLDDINIYDPTITNSEGELIQKHNLLLYPNPNNGSFQVEIGEDLIGEEYQLLNIRGQSLKQGNFESGNETLDISNEKAGIYFLQVPNRGIHKKVVIY